MRDDVDNDDMDHCPVCYEKFDASPEQIPDDIRSSSRLPLQSSRCAHKLCYSCMWQMKQSSNDDVLWLSCPKCRRGECFNTEEPIIDLSLCQALKMIGCIKQQQQQQLVETARIKDEQIELQKTQLNNAWKVEITGPNGKPIYAKGCFQDGNRFTPTLWNVKLEMQQQKLVPISVLENIEIRLGGVLYTSSLYPVEAQMDEMKWDGATQKQVLCHFGVGTEHGLWLPINISGWHKSHWNSLKEQDFACRGGPVEEQVDVYGTICTHVPRLFPNASVSFGSIQFFKEGVEQVIANIDLHKEDRTEEEVMEEKNCMDMLVATAKLFRKAGCREVGSAFQKRMTEVQLAASLLGIWRREHVREVYCLVLMNVKRPSPETTEEYIMRVMERLGVPNEKDAISELCDGLEKFCTEMEEGSSGDGLAIDSLCGIQE